MKRRKSSVSVKKLSLAGDGNTVNIPVSQYRTPPTEVNESKLPKEYRLWPKNGKANKVLVLSVEELKKKYQEFLKTKDPDWIVYHGHNTVTTFVTSKEDGLNSAIDLSDLLKLEMALTATRQAFYPKPKKKLLRRKKPK